MIIKDPKEQLRRNLSWRLLPQLQDALKKWRNALDARALRNVEEKGCAVKFIKPTGHAPNLSRGERADLAWDYQVLKITMNELQGENPKLFRRTRRDKTRNAFVERVADHLQTLHLCNFVYVERYWEDYVDRMAPLKQHDAIDTKGHSGKLRCRKTPLPQKVIREIADYAIPRSNERSAVWTDRLLYGLLAHYNDTTPEAIRGYIERRRKNKS